MNKSFESFYEAYTAQMHIKADGTKLWKLPNGQLHRIGGPAIEYADGEKKYYEHGELHREDGPAIEDPRLSSKGAYYLNDEYYNDHKKWAAAVLKMHNKPSDTVAVQEFLRTVLAKHTKDLI